MTTGSIFPLTLEQVRVKKRGKTILEDINLVFLQNGRTAIVGPNGSGKTTLLRLLHGLERANTGTVSWAVPAREAGQEQAFVFQHPIMMRRTVLDNLAYPLLIRGSNKKQARQAATGWAHSINLENQLKTGAGMLSGGEQQKLAVARALICDPQVLFLDEPTTNLDGQSTKDIEKLLLEASERGVRIILTTHDMGQARRLATDVIFLNRGIVCETATADTFFSNPQTPQANAYLRGDIVE